MVNKTQTLEQKLQAFRAFVLRRLPKREAGQMSLAIRILFSLGPIYVESADELVSVEELRYRFEIYFFRKVLGLSLEAPVVRRWFAPVSLEEGAVQKTIDEVEAAIDGGDPYYAKLCEGMFTTARALWSSDGKKKE